MDETQTQNGNKTILGIPCGCNNRKFIMGAGEWQIDAAVILGVFIVAACIFVATKKTSE